MRSIAKAQAMIRSLKERLEQRGLVCTEASDAGWPKLVINTDEASIKIAAVTVSTKNVIGQAEEPYTPHVAAFALRQDAVDQTKTAKIIMELAKSGLAVELKQHATVLATAEATAGEVLESDVVWPGHGM